MSWPDRITNDLIELERVPRLKRLVYSVYQTYDDSEEREYIGTLTLSADTSFKPSGSSIDMDTMLNIHKAYTDLLLVVARSTWEESK